jgi:hypothetical protein
MKLIGRYGNGLGALFFASLALYALSHGDIVVALFWIMVCALAGFNVYVFEKFTGPASEEERLAADLRAAELRRKLSRLAMDTPETVVRNHGP